MQCLYCKKKLGLFASRKKQFCSEQHEAAYNDELAGVALRRVLDPLFTERLPKAPLQSAPPARVGPGSVRRTDGPATQDERTPIPVSVQVIPAPVSETTAVPVAPALIRLAPVTPPPAQEATFHPVVAPPPHASFFRQPRPIPHPSTHSTALTPFGAELTDGQTELPQSFAELIEESAPVEAAVVESPAEVQAEAAVAVPAEAGAAPAEEPEAPEEGPALDSRRLHPALMQEKPVPLEMEPAGGARGVTRPLDFHTMTWMNWPSAVGELAGEPEVVTQVGPEAVTVESGATSEPAAVTGDTREEITQAEPEAVAAHEPEAKAPDGESEAATARDPQPAGLCAAPGRPQAVDELRKQAGETAGAIDPRLTLRYPSARIAIGRRNLGQAPDQSAEEWRAARVENVSPPAAIWHELAAAPARIPAPPAPENGRFPVAWTLHQFQRAPQRPGLRDVRWKMFTALREAPAKLLLPQPGSRRGSASGLARLDGNQFFRIERSPVEPGLARVERTVTREGAVELAEARRVRVPAAGAEVLAPVRESKMAESAWIVLPREAHADRRHSYRPSSLLAGLTGFQRARAASYIQIREPELRQAIPGGLPQGAARTGWHGVRPAADELPVRAAVPLRPAVRNPGWT